MRRRGAAAMIAAAAVLLMFVPIASAASTAAEHQPDRRTSTSGTDVRLSFSSQPSDDDRVPLHTRAAQLTAGAHCMRFHPQRITPDWHDGNYTVQPSRPATAASPALRPRKRSPWHVVSPRHALPPVHRQPSPTSTNPRPTDRRLPPSSQRPALPPPPTAPTRLQPSPAAPASGTGSRREGQRSPSRAPHKRPAPHQHHSRDRRASVIVTTRRHRSIAAIPTSRRPRPVPSTVDHLHGHRRHRAMSTRAPTVTCAPASGTGFAVGTTPVTCTAKDRRRRQHRIVTAAISVIVTTRRRPGSPAIPTSRRAATGSVHCRHLTRPPRRHRAPTCSIRPSPALLTSATRLRGRNDASHVHRHGRPTPLGNTTSRSRPRL